MKEMLRKNQFKLRLFCTLTLLLMCMVLVVSLLFYNSNYRNTMENEIQSSSIVLERVSGQITSLYNQMDIAATSLTKNPSLRQVILDLNSAETLEQRKEAAADFHKKRTIISLLTNMMFSSYISNVLLYNSDIPYFYYTGLYLRDREQIQRVLCSDSTAFFTESDAFERIYLGPHQSPWTTEDKVVLSVIRSFADAASTRNTLIEIQVPYSHLEAICSQNTFQNEKEFVLLNAEGEIVYPANARVSVLPADTFSSVLLQLSQGTAQSFSKGYAYYSAPILDGSFQVLLLSNNNSLKRYQKGNSLNAIITFIMLLAPALFLMLIILSVVTKPLQELIRYINRINLEEEARLQLPANSLNEFELINTSFNRMLEKMRESVRQTYEAKIRETNANLAALQAQINPHFLYNAMNSIGAASEIYGSETVSRMCQQFSSMMRYITSNRQNVRLIEEIEHTRNYLDFMKISYDGSFSYEINISPPLYQLALPRLIIQPLVENSFHHGFCRTEPPWFLSIHCYSKEQDWYIRIVDNGDGFEEDALKNFYESKASYQKKGTGLLFQELEIDGLGLKNILGRLFIFYGKHIDFNIRNLERGCELLIQGPMNIAGNTGQEPLPAVSEEGNMEWKK